MQKVLGCQTEWEWTGTKRGGHKSWGRRGSKVEGTFFPLARRKENWRKCTSFFQDGYLMVNGLTMMNHVEGFMKIELTCTYGSPSIDVDKELWQHTESRLKTYYRNLAHMRKPVQRRCHGFKPWLGSTSKDRRFLSQRGITSLDVLRFTISKIFKANLLTLLGHMWMVVPKYNLN
jgi:hypothetical protein